MYIEVNKKKNKKIKKRLESRLLIKGKCLKDGRTEKGQALVRYKKPWKTKGKRQCMKCDVADRGSEGCRMSEYMFEIQSYTGTNASPHCFQCRDAPYICNIELMLPSSSVWPASD